MQLLKRSTVAVELSRRWCIDMRWARRPFKPAEPAVRDLKVFLEPGRALTPAPPIGGSSASGSAPDG